MKKLVIDCRMINMSGIGTYIKNIIPGLIAANKFDVYCLGYEELKKFDWFAAITFILVDSKILSLSEQVYYPSKIPKCDVYWSPNWNIPVLAKIDAKKIIVSIHDVYHLANKEKFSFLQIAIMRFYLNRVNKIADRVITVSEFSKSEIIKYTSIEEQKISTIHLAVNENFNEGYHKDRYSKPNILYVGNVKPHKNLKLSLEAFSLIDDTEVFFYIVGRKEGFITNDKQLNSLIYKLGDRVIFTGQVSDDDLKNYYANASLFLFPSLYEGFGLPILEAMKFNLPILASRKGSIPEIAADHIMYFDAEDKYDLAKCINAFLKDRLLPDISGYEEHLKLYSWPKVVKEHLAILDK